MAIYRGTGGASDSTDDSTISAVTVQAGIATTKASEAASSAAEASTSATNAAASAAAASGHASTSSDNATASSGSVTDAAGFATAASDSATEASNSATAAETSATLANSTAVQAVAAKTTEITGVYNDIANVNTVAGNIADVNTVATNSSNITAVAGDASDIGTVAGSITNVNTVGDNIASVNTVASNNTNINTVAADASDIGTVAGISSNVTTVAGISNDVTTVAGLEPKLDTVIADAADIGTVAGNIGDVSTVAGISGDVDTVAGISADVTSVADNMTAVQNATTSATNAASSAASASNSASAASTSASTSQAFADVATDQALNALAKSLDASASKTAAQESKDAAASSAVSAGTSATNAAASAVSASASSVSASNSETAAAGSAGTALLKAAESAASAVESADSATDSSNAASTWSNYYNTYVGASSSEPTVDVQGNALVAGALYFNTTNNTTYVWTGSAWNAVANNNIINPNVALTQDLATNGNDVKLGDNDKATFGAGNDLQIYHDGTDSYVKDAGTGYLNLLGTGRVVVGHPSNGAVYLNANYGGDVELFFNNSKKFETTSTGIDVTGTATMDGLVVDANTATFSAGTSGDMEVVIQADTDNNDEGDSPSLVFKQDGGNTIGRVGLIGNANDVFTGSVANALYIGNDENANLQLYTNLKERVRISNGGDISFYEDTGTTPKMVWSASAEKLSLTGTSYAQPLLSVDNGSTGGHGAYIDTSGYTSSHYALSVNRNSGKQALRVDGLGDVSFYNTAGTTAKLTWDASAESLLLNASTRIGTEILTVNGTVTTGGGTASAPALAFRADSSTGIFRPASQSVGVSTNGSERLRIDSSGALLLHPNNSGRGLKITISTGQAVGSDTTYDTIAAGYGQHIFKTDGTERMRIDSAGRVGIGTSSPAADLQINDGNTTRGVAGTFHMYGSAVNGDAGNVSNEIFFRDETVSGWGGAFIRTVRPEDDQNGKDDLTFGTSPSGGSVVERLRIDSSGRVGIGVSAPTNTLEVAGNAKFTNASFGAFISPYGDDTYINMLGSGRIQFRTDGSEAMRIDASGNLLVGRTSASGVDTDGHVLFGNGVSYQSNTDNAAQFVNRNGTTDGSITSFYKNGTSVGSIGTDSSDLTIHGTVAGHTGFRFGNGEVYPTNNGGSLSDNTMSLGSNSVRFKDLYLSGGVYLGGTGAANKLDDYENGTWTPTALNYDGTMTVNSATYVKVGKLVTVKSSVSFDATADGSGVNISGLPFTTTGTAKANGGFVTSSTVSSAVRIQAVGTGSVYLLATDNSNVPYTTMASTTLEFVMIYEAA